MSPDRLGTALRGLVDDVEQGVAPPVAAELWSGGRRRRRTARLVPVLAAACVAALVALVVWPSGGPHASVPAVTLDGDGYARLTSYPSEVPKPPFIPGTSRPGVTAAVLADRGDTVRLYSVSPAGSVRELPEPDADSSAPPALSPDGRWLAQGTALIDLVGGEAVPSEAVRAELASTQAPPGEAWWSPDSRRVFVAAVNQGQPRSSGLVMGTDGSVSETPLLPGNVIPSVAGWLDADTLLAFVTEGGPTPRLEARTLTVESPEWEASDLVIQWPLDSYAGSRVRDVRADLSPDASRLLLTRRVADPEIATLTTTQAMVFDAATGAQLGMPASDDQLSVSSWDPSAYVEWGGAGCRPAWHDGLPVSTDDGRVFLPTVSSDDDLVDVSPRYESPCVAFAGSDLRGTPAADTLAVWQERIWVWGWRLLVVAGVVWVLWLLTRRRGWREGLESQRPSLPFLTSRG